MIDINKINYNLIESDSCVCGAIIIWYPIFKTLTEMLVK
jgi:hypothetical protein